MSEYTLIDLWVWGGAQLGSCLLPISPTVTRVVCLGYELFQQVNGFRRNVVIGIRLM
jgi:hypothetical protein